MVQGRLIRVAFVLALLSSIGAAHRPSSEPVLRSWLDDGSARPTLERLAREAEFRGCGNGDSWAGDVSGLYPLKQEDP